MECAANGTTSNEQAIQPIPALRRCPANARISGLDERLLAQRIARLIIATPASASTPFHLQAQEKPNISPQHNKRMRRDFAPRNGSFSAAVKVSKPQTINPTRKLSIRAVREKTNRKLFTSVK